MGEAWGPPGEVYRGQLGELLCTSEACPGWRCGFESCQGLRGEGGVRGDEGMCIQPKEIPCLRSYRSP